MIQTNVVPNSKKSLAPNKTSWCFFPTPLQKFPHVKLDHETPSFGVKLKKKKHEVSPPRKMELDFFKHLSLRILGPSNGGVGTCIAGVRVLKIGIFEGSGYLGYRIIRTQPLYSIKDQQIHQKKNKKLKIFPNKKNQQKSFKINLQGPIPVNLLTKTI